MKPRPSSTCDGPPAGRWTADLLPEAAARNRSAFSLIEMMVVLAIIGILAAVSAPAIRGISRTSGRSAAERQVMDAIGLARQMAIKNRTRVYLVFAPSNRQYGANRVYNSARINIGTYSDNASVSRLLRQLTNVYAGTLSSYAIVSSGAVGDQPGQSRWRYLQDWTALQDGVMFPSALFETNFFLGRFNDLGREGALGAWRYFPFPNALNIDYARLPASERVKLVSRLPAIGFEPTGKMVLERQVWGADANLMAPVKTITPGGNELWMALSEGSIFVPRTTDGSLDFLNQEDAIETPPLNYTNGIIKISALTGRARIEKPRLP